MRAARVRVAAAVAAAVAGSCLIGAAPTATAASSKVTWTRATVLAWVDGDWRVDDVRNTAGPTPINGPNDQPWDAEPFDKALGGFRRIDVVP